jgi:hypothetical protein
MEGKTMTTKQLETLRQKYPAGTKIRLIFMADEAYPVPPGTIGEVTHVDDIGNVHVRWQNGSSLALIPEADRFCVLRGDSE